MNTNWLIAPTAVVTAALTTVNPPVVDVAVRVRELARSILQPVNVAIPEAVASPRPDVHVRFAPAAAVNDSVIVFAAVTVLPPASSCVTIGEVPKFAPPVEPTGGVVNTRCVIAPIAVVTAALCAVIPPVVDVAVNVRELGARSILQPVNVAIPEAVASPRPDVHVRFAPAAAVNDSVIVFAAVTVLPPASSCVTIGEVPKFAPPVEPTGGVVNTNWLIAPTVITGWAPLTAGVNVPSVAVNVYGPAVLIAQPTNVATPLTVVMSFVPGVHVIATPAAGVPVIARCTALCVPVVTVLPPRSCNVTAGCVNATPPVESPG